MAIRLDFVKLPSDKRIAVWGGPSGGSSGIQDVDVPTEAELNNDGGASGMIPFSQSLSWSDTELPGMRESESTNEPSLADDAGYEEFGPSNYDATLSMFRPRKYDDPSNPHSLVYDLTDLTDCVLWTSRFGLTGTRTLLHRLKTGTTFRSPASKCAPRRNPTTSRNLPAGRLGLRV